MRLALSSISKCVNLCGPGVDTPSNQWGIWNGGLQDPP